MPSPPLLVELAKLFSVSTDYLLGLEPHQTVNVSGLNEKGRGPDSTACRPAARTVSCICVSVPVENCFRSI